MSNRRAFTLLELLVSMAVLALVVVLAASIVQMAARSWLSGKAQADNFAKARSSLDLIAREIRAGVFQRDVVAFEAPGGSPDFRFVSRHAATQGGRELQTLRYVVDGLDATEPAADEIGLFRTSRRWAFTQKAAITNELDMGAGTPQQIGPGVLAFAYRFFTANGEALQAFNFDYKDRGAAGNTGVVRIACAVADDRTLDLLVSTGSLKPLVEALQSDAEDGAAMPTASWEATFLSLEENNDLPVIALQGLRVFEFTIYLPVTDG